MNDLDSYQQYCLACVKLQMTPMAFPEYAEIFGEYFLERYIIERNRDEQNR